MPDQPETNPDTGAADLIGHTPYTKEQQDAVQAEKDKLKEEQDAKAKARAEQEQAGQQTPPTPPTPPPTGRR